MKILEEAIARLVVVLFVNYLPIIWRVVHRGSLTREVIFQERELFKKGEERKKKVLYHTLIVRSWDPK